MMRCWLHTTLHPSSSTSMPVGPAHAINVLTCMLLLVPGVERESFLAFIGGLGGGVGKKEFYPC